MSGQSARIAIVDDDVYIGDMLEELLTREGYRVLRAYSGTEALLLLGGACTAGPVAGRTADNDGPLEEQKPDLVLLDLMLPGLSGEEVLPHLAGIPVIVLSARAEVEEKVSLLLGGAADYLAKPFDTRELLARIAVQLRSGAQRHCGGGRWPQANDGPCALYYKNLTLDPAARTVEADGTPVRLTRTEFAILKLLMQNPRQVIPKSRLLDQLSLETPDCGESSLKVHVSNLRRKLREAGAGECIESVWGIGFKMAEQ